MVRLSHLGAPCTPSNLGYFIRLSSDFITLRSSSDFGTPRSPSDLGIYIDTVRSSFDICTSSLLSLVLHVRVLTLIL